VNENIRALLLLCVVNVTGFCVLLRNCDFSVGTEKTVLLVIGLYFKMYILLTKYDTVLEV